MRTAAHHLKRQMTKHQVRRSLLVAALSLLPALAFAADDYVKYNVVLMQPESVLNDRLPNVAGLAAYIEALESRAKKLVASAQGQEPTGGFIVVAVRPGQRSNFWFDFEPPLAASTGEEISKQLRLVMPVQVKSGPVVFALKVGLWGGKEPKRSAPSPSEWQAAAQAAGRPLEVGELVELIWHD